MGGGLKPGHFEPMGLAGRSEPMNVSSVGSAQSYEGAMLSKIKQVSRQQGEAAMKLIEGAAAPVSRPAAPAGTGQLVDTSA